MSECIVYLIYCLMTNTIPIMFSYMVYLSLMARVRTLILFTVQQIVLFPVPGKLKLYEMSSGHRPQLSAIRHKRIPEEGTLRSMQNFRLAPDNPSSYP